MTRRIPYWAWAFVALAAIAFSAVLIVWSLLHARGAIQKAADTPGEIPTAIQEFNRDGFERILPRLESLP